MKINVGTIDRVLRIVAGLVLIALAATGTVGWWGWLGVVPLATGLFRFCPAYPLLGISAGPLKRELAQPWPRDSGGWGRASQRPRK